MACSAAQEPVVVAQQAQWAHRQRDGARPDHL